MVFTDSDFFIGLYNSKDPHHKNCLKLIEKITDGEMLTSYDVVDEVSTKLSYYTEKGQSLKFLEQIMEQKIMLVYPSTQLFLHAYQFFQSQKSKRVSWTDCMNMAITREKKIDTFLSFDAIYEKNGFHLAK